MPTSTTIRMGRHGDLVACTDIWRSTVDPTLPPATAPYGLYGHELDTGTLLVAERDGEVIGFGASITRGRRWFLADLFVSPDVHGAGTGRRLIDDLLIIDRPGAVRATMASSDVRALTLYTKLGMSPRWPCFVLRSGAAGVAIETLGAARCQLDLVDGEALVSLADAADYSLDRADIDYWRREVDADLMSVTAPGGTVIGGAIVRWSTPFSIADPTTVSVGPLFAVTGENLSMVVAAVLEATLERSQDRVIKLYVPGPNPLLAPLLDSGFSITDYDLFAASTDDVLDPHRVFPSHDLL